MTTRYHVGRNGQPSPCKAEKWCPLGGAHADSPEAIEEHLINSSALELETGVLRKKTVDPLRDKSKVSVIQSELPNGVKANGVRITSTEMQSLQNLKTNELTLETYKHEARAQHEANLQKVSLLVQGLEARGYEVKIDEATEEDSRKPPFPREGQVTVEVYDKENSASNGVDDVSHFMTYKPPRYDAWVTKDGTLRPDVSNGKFTFFESHSVFGGFGGPRKLDTADDFSRSIQFLISKPNS